MKLRLELIVVSSGPTTAIESEDAAIAGVSLARMRKSSGSLIFNSMP
jgi:hypothetical protein